MDTKTSEEKKVNAKLSNFERPMTFNEWSEKLGVSSRYIEPTKYFRGNPSCGINTEMNTTHQNPIVKFFNLLFT